MLDPIWDFAVTFSPYFHAPQPWRDLEWWEAGWIVGFALAVALLHGLSGEGDPIYE